MAARRIASAAIVDGIVAWLASAVAIVATGLASRPEAADPAVVPGTEVRPAAVMAAYRWRGADGP